VRFLTATYSRVDTSFQGHRMVIAAGLLHKAWSAVSPGGLGFAKRASREYSGNTPGLIKTQETNQNYPFEERSKSTHEVS
jgi:hypothetical protein